MVRGNKCISDVKVFPTLIIINTIDDVEHYYYYYKIGTGEGHHKIKRREFRKSTLIDNNAEK